MLYDSLHYKMYKDKDIKINEDLYSNNREEGLVNYMLDVMKAYERIPNIKLVGHEHITDDTLIEPYRVNQNYAKSKIDYKHAQPINEDRYELLRVFFEVDGKTYLPGKKGKEGDFPFTIEVLMPKRYKKFYYLLGGNKFYPIYQLIESSTYSMKNSVSLKPMNLVRDKVDYFELDGEEFSSIQYNLLVFGKKVNPLLLFGTAMGLDNALKYLFVNDIIEVKPYEPEGEEDSYTFRCKNNMVVVLKYFYDNDRYIQSVVSSLIDIFSDKVFKTTDDYEDREIWGEKLGACYLPISSKNTEKKIEKSREIISSFSALATNIYKSNLKLDHLNKDTMFSILRWLMQNFTELKLKDSLDLKNKRIRLNEYIADYFTQIVNDKLNRFIGATNKKTAQITEKELKNLFRYPQNILIKKLMSAQSPLLRYDNTVNDLDFFNAFKYSIKGPSSVSANSKQIPISLMAIHHSYIGRIDLTSSSASEPNVTGFFTPFTDTHYGKFFDTAYEPQEWLENFCKMYANQFNGCEYKIPPLEDYEGMINTNYKLFNKLQDIEKFVGNYTGSDRKVKIIDVHNSGRKKGIRVIKPETRVLHEKSKSLFKNIEKEEKVIRKLFKRQ